MKKLCVTLILVLIFAFSGIGVESVFADYILKNEKIEVKFDDDGLAAIRDIFLNRTFNFSDEGFMVTIDEEKIDSEELKPEGVNQKPSQLTYKFDTPEFVIEVVFELKPDWHFVSKQIFVEPKTKSSFRVNEITVLSGVLVERPVEQFVPRTKRPEFKVNDYGAFLRFEDKTGLMMLVQNPFLTWHREGKIFSITYNADMDWKTDYGRFTSDRGCIGSYGLTGRMMPDDLVPEWEWTGGALPTGKQDSAEVEAFTKCVKTFILPHPAHSINMNGAWCENDYQIDVATKEGRDEYKRIIDRCKEMGIDYVLYAPTHSEMGSRDETADDWNWENLLWLGMGLKVRNGQWDPEKDELPGSIQEMVDYAASKDIKLVAYMYPVMPFAGNDEWIVEGSQYHAKKRNASLGVRSFQDWLIRKLSAFYERTIIGGYAYDYTFLWYEGTSRYAQWYGWKRVKEALRLKYPEIVIDGRQLDMCYGPWTWLSGSYPHPTATDEQPESFLPFPDLHFDRVSANRQRYTAYRYRVNDYCPSDIMPGFITHQTSRSDGDTGKGKPVLRLDSFRVRDWDYLGWKFSLISSIGTGGLNNIVSMIPARDEAENENFSDEDKKFFRDWLDWTDTNRRYLLNTRFIIGQPAIGRVDGTSAIVDDRGFIFLFNPNGRKMTADFKLDKSIGLNGGNEFTITEIYPVENKKYGKLGRGLWNYGDDVSIEMDGGSAIVLKITPGDNNKKPLLFNVKGDASLWWGKLKLKNVTGQVGKKYDVLVKLSKSKKVKKLVVNGQRFDFTQNGNMISFSLKFAGDYFSKMQQVDNYDAKFEDEKVTGSFVIPERIKKQLQDRKTEWPIPWTKEDYRTSWLVPERQLLFIQIAEVKDDMDVQLSIDGEPVGLTKAYTSVRVHPRCFTGFYADLSGLSPDKEYSYELKLPKLKKGQYQGMFFENVENEYTQNIQLVTK